MSLPRDCNRRASCTIFSFRRSRSSCGIASSMTTRPSSWRLLTAFSRLREVRRPLESSSRLGLIETGCVDTNRWLILIVVLPRTDLVERSAREAIIGADEVIDEKCSIYLRRHRTRSIRSLTNCLFLDKARSSVSAVVIWKTNMSGRGDVVRPIQLETSRLRSGSFRKEPLRFVNI